MSREAAAFDCGNCRFGRHCDESNPAPADGWWEIKGVIKSRTCLLPMITPQSHFLLRIYQHYKNGFLPYRGGLLDQPNYFLEAMEVIDRAVNTARGKDTHGAKPH